MKKVYGYIDEKFDQFVDELIDLCRYPSISAQKKGLQACAGVLVEHIRAIGLHGEIMPMGGPDNPPLVYGRLDVPGAK